MNRLSLPLSSDNGSPPSNGPLSDTFGRVHKSARISLTDKCNLRCSYCMNENASFLPDSILLDRDDIHKIAKTLVGLGVNRFRLTGGEPLLRKDVISIVSDIYSISPNIDVSMTTNGIMFNKYAKGLFESGLKRITFSLDTLDRQQFQAITRRNFFDQTIDAIRNAKKFGWNNIKINSVITKNCNENQIVPLINFAGSNNYEIRFIESMPIGDGPWDYSEIVSSQEILSIVENNFGKLTPLTITASSPAETWITPQGYVVGVIASVTRPFCSNCDRLRITADGFVRSCLFATTETDLKPALRPSLNTELLETLIRSNLWKKEKGHEISTQHFIKPPRTMHSIGG